MTQSPASPASRMRTEALQASAAVARQLACDGDTWAALAHALHVQPPTAVLTVARGSSDHAAHYLAYLAMARLGRLVTSLPMSLVTLYPSRVQGRGLLALAFSQSGHSPDLVMSIQTLRQRGACTVALVNDTRSPLAQAASWVLPLHAGAEHSVAATKSTITQLVAGARLVANWPGDERGHDRGHVDGDGDGDGPRSHPDAHTHMPSGTTLLAALQDLPDTLTRATACDWSAAVAALVGTDRLFVVSRGLGLAVAMEAALKFKETCGIQAEAFSGAELRHGPMALVQPGYAVLILAPRGPAQAGLLELAQDLRQRGAGVLLAAPVGTPGADLPLVCTGHEDLDPIAALQSFYPFVEALARARGLDPDSPPHLSKITRTR